MYYSDTKDTTLSELLRKASVNTEKHLMAFSYYSWQDDPNTVKIKGAYIIFYQCGPIDYGTHDLGPVSKSSAEK